MSKDAGSQGGEVQDIRSELDDDLLASADDAGVDVDEIIKEKLESHSGYGASTVARFVSSQMKRQIEAEQGDELKGILVGSRDRYGRNWPRRHSLVRSSGDHLEVATWEGKLPGPNGRDLPVPAGGAIVSMSAEYDSEYDSWEGKRIESLDPLPAGEMVEKVGKVAMKPSDISRDDEYNVVAVQGEIAFVNPQTVFEDGEPAGDGPILMADERGEPRPHFEIVLQVEGNTMVRGHLERMKYARPYLAVPDMEPLVEDAAELPNPDEQAQFLQDGLQGAELLMVGNVSSVDVVRTDEQGGGKRKYVDIGVTGLLSTDDLYSSVDSLEDTTPSDHEADPEPGPEAEDTREISAVREDIEQYASLTGTDVADLTVEDVNDAMDLDDPDMVIREALKGEGADDDATADAVDDPLEEIKEAGTLNCPAGDLFQCSSRAELVAHVHNEHKAGMDPANLEDWVRGQIDG